MLFNDSCSVCSATRCLVASASSSGSRALPPPLPPPPILLLCSDRWRRRASVGVHSASIIAFTTASTPATPKAFFRNSIVFNFLHRCSSTATTSLISDGARLPSPMPSKHTDVSAARCDSFREMAARTSTFCREDTSSASAASLSLCSSTASPAPFAVGKHAASAIRGAAIATHVGRRQQRHTAASSDTRSGRSSGGASRRHHWWAC
mmetsp:Transcript_35324/g.86348  ORF Transcript_35324/g.86348 Transcript_35324/m.86348 type:complete len:207 (-) Transcript_35324:77-697(-)